MLPQSKYLERCSRFLSSVNLSGKNCLVVGATQGIGRAVALKLASLGANVTISGRSNESGSKVIEAMRNKGTMENQMHSFERVDLTSQNDSRRFYESTASKLSKSGGLDHLFLTAGKPPNGKQSLTEEGIEAHFALQCLGRYSAALHFGKIMNSGGSITAVCAPGSGSSMPLDDMEYLKPENKSKYGLIMAASRDSLFVDSVLMQIASSLRSNDIKVNHLFPGGVSTNASQTADLPFPIPLLGKIFGPYVLTSAIDYAVTPIYEALSPSSSSHGNYHARNQYGTEIKMKPWVLDTKNREAVMDYAAKRVAETLLMKKN